jgi:hypothetical protein
MAKEVDQRLLRKLIPGCSWTTDLESPYIHLSNSNGWSTYTNDSNLTFLVYRTYFDITGWSKEQISAFVTGVGWQESDRWSVTNPAPTSPQRGQELQSWDIVSKSGLENTILDAEHWVDLTGYYGWCGPGMIQSNYNLEEIFAGRMRQWIPNINLNNLVHQTAETLWGAGDATAGDRIHITRIVNPWLISTGSPPDVTEGYVPPQAVVCPTAFTEETDLVYLERLRRSYVDAGERT